ncbi:hypothetical protein B9G55_02330 [Saccharibacillus sp. O16]|nr:hypothetical protein B9G55_02330 [Saccharibacillus sp. O16]
MNDVNKKRAARIVVGTLAGAGAAWFLASRKGAGARQKIRELAVQTKELGMEIGHETAEKTRDLIALGREISHDEDWKEAIETQDIKPLPEEPAAEERAPLPQFPSSEPHLSVVPPPEHK